MDFLWTFYVQFGFFQNVFKIKIKTKNVINEEKNFPLVFYFTTDNNFDFFISLFSEFFELVHINKYKCVKITINDFFLKCSNFFGQKNSFFPRSLCCSYSKIKIYFFNSIDLCIDYTTRTICSS